MGSFIQYLEYTESPVKVYYKGRKDSLKRLKWREEK